MGDNKPTSFSQYSRRRKYDLAEDTIVDYAGTHHIRILKRFESPSDGHPPGSIGEKLISPEHNRVFHLRFYLPKPALVNRQQEIRDVVIMFNGLNEIDRFDLYDVLGQHFAERGMAAVLLPTPYHLNRCYPDRAGRHVPPHKILFKNPMLLFHNYKQSMMDSELLIKKLRNERPDDSDFGFYQSLFAPDPRISILGFSLGGLRALASFMHEPEKYHTCIIFNSGVQLSLLDISFLRIAEHKWKDFVASLDAEGQKHRAELVHDPYWERFNEVCLGNAHTWLKRSLRELSHKLLFILSGGDQIVPPNLTGIESEGHGLTSLKIAGVGHIPTTDPKWTYWMDRVAEFIIGFVQAKQNVWSAHDIIDEVATLLADSSYMRTLVKSSVDFGSSDLQHLLDCLPAERQPSLLRLFYASMAYHRSFREVLNGVAFAARAARADAYLETHLGKRQKWATINQLIWNSIGTKVDHKFNLSEIDSIAKESSADGAEVLSVLALLSRPASDSLQMTFRHDSALNAGVTMSELMPKLQAWWRDRSISNAEWKNWAGNILVQWAPRQVQEETK